MPTPAIAREALDALGIEDLCEMVVAGDTLTVIAEKLHIHVSQVVRWIEADPQRSAQAREARSHAAFLYDEQALHELRDATDPTQVPRAREIAQHLRWRASKVAPKIYGDRQQVQHTGPNGGPVQVASIPWESLPTEKLEAVAAAMRGLVEGDDGNSES